MELLITSLNEKYKDYLIVFKERTLFIYRTKKALVKNEVDSFVITGHHRVGSLTSEINGIIESDKDVTEFATKHNLN